MITKPKSLCFSYQGALKTVRFNVETLGNHHSEIANNYTTDKESLTDHKKRSSVLINFVMNKGSYKLKDEFTWSSDKWIELASYEYSISKK
ncbi:hypothetical protein [uncultured Aquimarina sp.]|uniref:hypothetical protein n=1 Tax=uncultured Aquimarina sp. TaxID=575652 RepID=UPI0026252827|nr:hypothetical protein [uncultured Aquimarina sp.]